MAAQWTKIAADLDSHPKVRKAGRDGREVFLFVLRKNAQHDFNGCVPASHLEPWYLADQLMMDEVTASNGLSRAVTAGLLTLTDDGYLISGWDDEWAKRPLTTAERQERFRQKHKLNKPVDESVTGSNGDSVTGNASNVLDKSREDKIRQEEKKERSASPPSRSRSKPTPPELSDEERQAVDRVLTKLSKHSGVAYRNAGNNQKLILSRLRAGYSDEDLRIVVGYCALELNWEQKPNMKPYLRPKTLFGPENFDEYVDPARSWYAAINRQENRTA